MGICHGGVLMTLADIAAANGVNVARGAGGQPTINLAVDFYFGGSHRPVDTGRRAPGDGKATLWLLQWRDRQWPGVVARFNGTFTCPITRAW